jgi:hypothetical protein
VHEERRQARALVGNLNVLDPRTAQAARSVAEAVHAARVGGESLDGLGLQEALADVVVVGGSEEIGRGARVLARGGALAADLLQRLRHARPLLEPHAVVVHPRRRQP